MLPSQRVNLVEIKIPKKFSVCSSSYDEEQTENFEDEEQTENFFGILISTRLPEGVLGVE